MVVDASVVVSRLVPHDVHHEASRRWLARHVAGGGLVIAPALLNDESALTDDDDALPPLDGPARDGE